MHTHAVTVVSAVVVNPSKVLDLDELRQTVHALLTEAGWPEPTWYETTREDPGRGQARQAVESGARVVFVCGGDGTVRSCVSELAGTEVALAVLPAGTGNLLAANLGLTHDLIAGIEVALAGGMRRIDVGAVDGECFAVMAGMGFDADMLAATSEATKARIGWPAYVFGGLRHLRGRPMRVSIQIDDEPPIRRRARTVLIANVGRLTGGLRLLRDAEPDDGAFDVAVLTPRTLGHWASLAWAVVRRRKRVPRMEVFRGRSVRVTSNRDQPRELDGDLIAPGRVLRVEMLPEALWLCVPRPASAPDLAESD
ncbi:diacylglycerol/lipid kinase family protein [Phytohabitans kaempferiae]|uniref:Diacylglycerol/lipid kinase family protein n=1 Tax=Phytohabitans kaempferiae TaxID=1620943 RepID=A0ABV6M4D2_9ACTN